MTFFLSDLHNELREARLKGRGKPDQPAATGTHKKYPRMEQIKLPKPAHLTSSLEDALAMRHSATSVAKQQSLTLADLGTLLGLAFGRQDNKSTRRHYPSGGALYPIESYLISSAVEGTEPAVFHYNPTEHVLEKLWNLPQDLMVSDLAHGGPENLDFPSLIVFTSVWGRSAAKYGDFAYILALLEAGHMSENILLVATACGLETRPFGGFDEKKISSLLDLNDVEEQVVQTIALIKPAGTTTGLDRKKSYEE